VYSTKYPVKALKLLKAKEETKEESKTLSNEEKDNLFSLYPENKWVDLVKTEIEKEFQKNSKVLDD